MPGKVGQGPDSRCGFTWREMAQASPQGQAEKGAAQRLVVRSGRLSAIQGWLGGAHVWERHGKHRAGSMPRLCGLRPDLMMAQQDGTSVSFGLGT